ncbi:MAG: HAMP domain-containing sensor histidine kinase, partial [Ilumatobacteraceae bacterium]
PDLPPRALEAVAMMSRQVAYFERLVLDLLEISRFDSGVELAELEETDLFGFVDSISRDLGGPPVEPAGEPEPVRVGLDRRRMERILRNLIENANRYAGGAVRIGVEVSASRIVIEVDDAGDGIAPDERDRIFERFWRGRHARHHESKGSGLGLALVAEHVRLLGGTITVGDAAAGGARFTVELPIREGW